MSTRTTLRLSLCCWIAVGARLPAAEILVPAQFPSIQEAIAAAEDGDTVTVAPSVYEIDRPISLMGKAITVRGAEGAEATTVRMTEPADPLRACVFAFENAEPPGTRLEGFTIEGGRGILLAAMVTDSGVMPDVPFAGGIYVGPHAEPEIESCVLRGNSSLYGGGIGCDADSRPRLRNVTWIENDAIEEDPDGWMYGSGGGIACLLDSVVEIESSRFEGNQADRGGAVHVAGGGSLEASGVLFVANRSLQADGGAVDARGDRLTLGECVFERNLAADDGGGLHVRGVWFLVEDCLFERNRATDSGGGLYADLPRWPLEREASVCRRCRFLHNTASDEGGGALVGYESSMVRIDDSLFEHNSSSTGGGLYCDYESDSAIAGSVFYGNQALMGGAIYLDESYASICRCTLAGNAAGLGGGICYFPGEQQISRSIIWGNAGGNLLDRWGAHIWEVTWRPDFVVSNCCIESDLPELPGPGNISLDPRLEGWAPRPDVYVDAAAPDGGDGSEAHPYRELADALSGYSLALAADSPCRGGALDGTDIGADTGVAAVVHPPQSRRIHLAPGTYRMDGHHLGHGASIEGSGAESTIIEGTIFGLRTGESLRGVTVTKGLEGGIVIGCFESPLVEACRIWRNRSPEWEGGALSIWRDSAAQVTGCAIEENVGEWELWGSTCVCSYNSGEARLSRCRIAGNETGGFPGSWEASVVRDSGDGSSLRLENCLIAGNLASHVAVRWASRPAPLLVHCTLADNRATDGYTVDAPATSSNMVALACILWDESGARIRGTTAHCLIGIRPEVVRRGTFDFDRRTPVEIEGVSYSFPDFIVDEGDYHLRPESPAIDALPEDAATAVDLDGTERPCWNGYDIGAYEYCGAEPPEPSTLFRRGEVNLDASLDLSDAVFVLGYLFLGGEAPSCVKSADIDDSGGIDITDAVRLLGYLFLGGLPPAEPFAGCGTDPHADELSCVSYPPCP
ncbi:MAG: right-handed parallel beta-helix repeat-containing protein [Planctomycetes bacterium]|nr:right-handed parallel beta-helix repeat-containing protein [Planctomycetota bacterium]